MNTPKKTYLYHYHAMLQLNATTVVHMDGIYGVDNKILGYSDDYTNLKVKICEDGYEGMQSKLTVCSLTLLD